MHTEGQITGEKKDNCLHVYISSSSQSLSGALIPPPAMTQPPLSFSLLVCVPSFYGGPGKILELKMLVGEFQNTLDININRSNSLIFP